MTAYKVDKNQMNDYIKNLDKRRVSVFVIIALVVLSSQAFIAFNIDSDFPFWVIIIATIIILISFYVGLRLSNDKLKQFSAGKFFIDNSSLKLEGVDNLTKEFKLDEISIVHKKHSGTFVVKGNGWTKFDYIRPKRTSPYHVGGLDVIFIPTITSNYLELVNKVKQTAKNAMKL